MSQINRVDKKQKRDNSLELYNLAVILFKYNNQKSNHKTDSGLQKSIQY